MVIGPPESALDVSCGLRSVRLILPSFLANSSFCASCGLTTSVATVAFGAALSGPPPVSMPHGESPADGQHLRRSAGWWT